MPKLIEVLRDAAPAIGAAMTTFGGPLGAAGAAVLTGVLGLPKDADEKAIAKAMEGATPEQLLALKKADQDFAVQMAQIDLQRYQAALTDVASARQRQVQLNDPQPMYMGWTILCGFIGVVTIIIWFVFTGQAVTLKDPTVAGIIGTLIGYLSAKADQVVSFYFGSSSESKHKTSIMDDWFKSTP